MSFIQIYFSDGNYIEKMHNHIVEQIKSYAGDNFIISENNFVTTKGIIINNKYMEIPNIPEQFISNKLAKDFTDGIMNSIYFIK